MSKEYKPISCSLHDSLESFAVKKSRVIVVYKNENDVEQMEDSIIEDVYSENKQEFIRLKNGYKIRLDRILQVNEVDFKP